MQKRTILFALYFVFMLLLSTLSLKADDEIQAEKTPKFYVEPFAGYHTIPGFLLNIWSESYPKGGLNGHIEGIRAGYFLNNNFALGISAIHSGASGKGKWGDKNIKKESYDSHVHLHGKADVEMFGAGAEGTGRLHLLDNLNLLARFSLGVGYITARFDGFLGGSGVHDSSIVIHEPVDETYHHIIPMVGAGVGLEWTPIKQLSIIAGPYWNTGIGGEASLQYRFDIF